MQLSLDSYPTHSPDVIGQVVEHEAVLVLPTAGEVKVLNEVGARIWALADGTRTIREIAAIIHTEYDADAQRIEADTIAFVADLVQRNIVMLV
jgi:hypothetical protein